MKCSAPSFGGEALGNSVIVLRCGREHAHLNNPISTKIMQDSLDASRRLPRTTDIFGEGISAIDGGKKSTGPGMT